MKESVVDRAIALVRQLDTNKRGWENVATTRAKVIEQLAEATHAEEGKSAALEEKLAEVRASFYSLNEKQEQTIAELRETRDRAIRARENEQKRAVCAENKLATVRRSLEQERARFRALETDYAELKEVIAERDQDQALQGDAPWVSIHVGLPEVGVSVLALAHLGWKTVAGADQYSVHIVELEENGRFWSPGEGKEVHNIRFWAFLPALPGRPAEP